MKLSIIKPGSKATDIPSGLAGIVTHAHVEMDGRVQYLLQPHGLNPETGQPVKRLWTLGERLKGAEADYVVDLPLDVLGTPVEDSASGFKGTAVSIQLHISGCLHVQVQPVGTLQKTGDLIESCDFDIRRLEGVAIKKLTEAERDADQKVRPSPGPSASPLPRMPR